MSKKSSPKSHTKPPTDGVRVHKKGRAIVTTKLGSVYENDAYAARRPWMRSVTSEQIADRVEWLRKMEDEPPEEDTRSEQQRKRAEYDRSRPRRHQVTLPFPFPFKPEEHPTSEFAATYPHEDVPFTERSKPKKQSKVKGKLVKAKSPYRIVVRRRYPLQPKSVPKSVTELPSESDTHSAD
jgi:hypothetical protein